MQRKILHSRWFPKKKIEPCSEQTVRGERRTYFLRKRPLFLLVDQGAGRARDTSNLWLQAPLLFLLQIEFLKRNFRKFGVVSPWRILDAFSAKHANLENLRDSAFSRLHFFIIRPKWLSANGNLLHGKGKGRVFFPCFRVDPVAQTIMDPPASVVTPSKINGWNPKWRLGSDDVPFQWVFFQVPAVHFQGRTQKSCLGPVFPHEILRFIEKVSWLISLLQSLQDFWLLI